MRRFLNWIYSFSGLLAALLIMAICLIVSAQVFANLTTKLFGTSFSLTIPSYAVISGYFLAASSFLALAYTFNNDGHIRVLLVRDILPKRISSVFDKLMLAVAAMTAAYMTYYMAFQTLEAHEFGDTSPGIVAIPLYIPQLFVFLGLLIFTISLIDAFVRSFNSAEPVVQRGE